MQTQFWCGNLTEIKILDDLQLRSTHPKHANTVLVRKPNGNEKFGRPRLGRTILKWIFKK